MALTNEDFEKVANDLGCEPAAVMAVQQVETGGAGGFNPDGTPKTLFEGHWFSKFTNHIYDASHPTISYPKWTREFYGKTWQAEQARLEQARQLDQDSAFKSASWGMFQVMGFNFASLGYPTITDFVAAMAADELSQLEAFAGYVKHNNLADELQRLDWAGFASRYNGPEYAQNHYDTKLAAAYAAHKGCLLYTSPSPRDYAASRMPSSA